MMPEILSIISLGMLLLYAFYVMPKRIDRNTDRQIEREKRRFEALMQEIKANRREFYKAVYTEVAKQESENE